MPIEIHLFNYLRYQTWYGKVLKVKIVGSTFLKIYALHLSCKTCDIFQIAQNKPFHIHGDRFMKFKHMVH
jgi:hypothetical protein